MPWISALEKAPSYCYGRDLAAHLRARSPLSDRALLQAASV